MQESISPLKQNPALKKLIPQLQNIFVCPVTQKPLIVKGEQLTTPDGLNSYPLINDIPRFTSSDHYVKSFSFEWNTHNKTQLDIYRGDSSSEDIFIAKTGLTKNDVDGKLVLDAGVGAGRFSDVLSRWNANVVGIDLSYAVEAAHQNFLSRENIVIAQADISHLPFQPETFDFIISIGVLHHTSDTKAHFQKLVPYLKKGGKIVIWLYPNEGSFKMRSDWIPFTRRIPDQMFYRWCRWFVPFAKRHERSSFFKLLSEIFPYSQTYLGIENDILDTFDGFSPRYHWVHSAAEVIKWFEEAGLSQVQSHPLQTTVSGTKSQILY